MDVKLLLSLVIVTQVSCDKHSLTLVIDDTYSLIDDIKQVINASKLIVGFENASDIEDYVLVTFNDPETVLRKKTQNPKELIEALDSIKVHDGSKAVCPEVALSALKLALNESREGSRFYVFTDSSARDSDKFEEVKALCQAKKSQVYFILSGHCGDISARRYQVYQKLAAACKGQAITVDKDDVAQVPEYLKKIIDGDRHIIESVVIPANKWSNTSIKFNIDVLTEKTIISASGIDVDLEITTARNMPIRRGNKTWTRNFKVFEPTRLRGTYTVKVRGKSPVEVMIMARTNFTFEYGFSMESVTAVKETDPQPFTDIKTRLTIFAKDPEGSAEVKGVELHAGTKTVPLPLTRVADNVYATEEFLSPGQPFKIAVVAIAKKAKKNVKSFAKTVVTPIKPGSVEQIKVKEGASIDVHCRTPSNKTKAQITWYEKTTKEGNFSVIKRQTKEVLHVDKPVDKVYYKCLARNATGTDQFNGQIDIQVQPEFFYPPAVVLSNINDLATIECKIFKGNPLPKITWEFKHVNATKYEQLSNQNDTYNLASAHLEDSGEYRCFANSTAGSAEKITKLVVQVNRSLSQHYAEVLDTYSAGFNTSITTLLVAPEILKSFDKFTVKEGTSIDVECRILNGIPKPEITWYSKQQDATDFEEIVGEKNETLHVTRAKTSKIYKCEAKNSAGIDSYIVNIYVKAVPEFKLTTPNVTVNEGDPATIDCKLYKGSPPLERSWERKLKGMTSFSTLKHEAEELDITAAQLSHAGDYKCVAMNSEGRAEKVTELIVQAIPSIEDVASNQTALENSNVILQCRISKGFPKPTVNWFYKGPALPDFVNMSKTGEALLLENVQVSFSGLYKCVAQNVIGRAEQIVQLVVNAPPKIIFVPPNTAKHTAVEGDPVMRLQCAAVGHPTPVITWLVDDKIVGLDKCQLPQETGPCHAGLTKWYYDQTLKECRIFTYGGCYGNDNRFDSKEECAAACASRAEPVVPTPGKCQQPMVVGPCYGAISMWYYDNTFKQCLPFTYGGCSGNENRFDSKAACEGECALETQPKDKCQLPQETGPCHAGLTKWYYDQTLKECRIFTYGGCYGNDNRFDSKEECAAACASRAEPVVPTPGKCQQPMVVGPCYGAISMWYYDNTFKQCLPFTYGGCSGNENRFDSKAACEGECALETQPKDKCQLPQETGPCHAGLTKWYYDQTLKECRIFTYGGCYGNDNRFDSKEECAAACASRAEPVVPTPGKCQQPMVVGPCYGAISMWYYDNTFKQCLPFTYGGCSGNENRFDSKAACEGECALETQPKDQCQLPQETGPCHAGLTKWYYDQTLKECRIFTYGGCYGNDNRFDSKEECAAACASRAESVVPTPGKCQQPMVVGPCYGAISMWYYDNTFKQCLPFTYGGCSGNENRFDSKAACEGECALETQPKDKCQLPQETGPCHAGLTKWYYDQTLKECRIFTYGGCYGNDNRFDSKEECAAACASRAEPVVPTPGKCQQPMVVGPCYGAISMWYYDNTFKQCLPFTYGGCSGNENRFDSKAACEGECALETQPKDKCQLPQETGPCHAGLTKWYYDQTLKECRIFTYGGCYGNDNRFDSKEECAAACASRAEPVVPTPGKCQQPMVVGPCYGAISMWYYDNTFKQCLPFTYGGCSGNENRFDSKAACEGECALETQPKDKCQLPQETGPCHAGLTKWYYDQTLKECRIFTYGGCYGNDNRFDSKEECAAACASRAEPVVPTPGKCQQPMVVGPCYGAISMWYYDNTFKQCLPFTYGGCSGNENRFDSKAACESECALETQPKDHIEFSKVNEIYAPYNKPYYIKCSLPSLDPSSIKWYKNSKLIPDRTGPSLHIDDPSDVDSGNYTCRVSGLTDSASRTVQVIFGQRPMRNQTLYNVEWKGDEKSLNCYSFEYPEGKYEWFFDGKGTGLNNETIKVTAWGEYICNVKNPLGNLDIVYKVTTPDKGCRVPKSLFTSEHAPLVLTSTLSWPLLRTAQEHFLVPRSEKLQLICQDDNHSPTKNSFTRFPNVKSLYAACEKEDSFTVDGNIRKISEFECKQKVTPSAVQTKIQCLGNGTELIQVGFSVDGFAEVYQSCMDLNKMVPLYTKLKTIPVKREYVVSDASTEDTCEHVSECCYEAIQLVNGIDVSFGPAKSATAIHALNSVNYCKLKDDFDWYNIEIILRSEIQFNGTVWTGAAHYMKVDIDGETKDVPRYLWKVLLYYSGSDKEIVAIIHENVASPGPQLCAGACGNKTTIFEPIGDRTYCCSFEDFKKALGIDLHLDL